MTDPSELELWRGALHLERLQRLTDVVYGIIIYLAALYARRLAKAAALS